MAFVVSDRLHRSWPGPDPVCSWAGPGAGLGTPAAGPRDRRTGLVVWAQTPYLPVPSPCQAAGPQLPPSPSLPLCPLHRLVRALTCEIKRDFNYLSAKQQLERITAQQQSLPHALPLPCLPSPLFLQLPQALRLDGTGSPPIHLRPPVPQGWGGEAKGREGVCAGGGAGVQRGAQVGPPCASIPCRQPVPTSLGSVWAPQGYASTACALVHSRPCVCAWLARVNTRVCMQACQQPGAVQPLG